MDCIFCGIFNGSVESSLIYKAQEGAIFLDLFPASKGHSLVVPREHKVGLQDLTQDELSWMMGMAQKLGNQMRRQLGCQGINLLLNDGKAAGQVVFHCHLHVIPRYESSPGDFSYFGKDIANRAELDALAEQLSLN